MIISHKKKFIFIHIYKTGGTSIYSSLISSGRLIERLSGYYHSRYIIKIINRLFHLQDKGNEWINGVHKHATAIDMKNYLNEDIFNYYFKFAFVRNPFDWLVSLYHYLKGSKGHRNYTLANKLDFGNFVLRYIKIKSPLQSDFITENDNIIVDYIGKLESLQDDLNYIYKRIGLSHLSEKTIPWKNKSIRNNNYMEYYDEDLKKKVIEYFKKDFVMFGYKYD